MKKRIIRIVLVLVILAGAGFGIRQWREGKAVLVTDELVLHGNSDMRQVELAFNNSERIESILVEEGDSVSKGQLLATLETKRIQMSLDRAEAEAEAQAQVVAAMETGTRPQEIERLRAEVKAAEIQAANALKNAERLEPLAKDNLTPRQQADDARAAADGAAAKLRALKESLDLAIAGPREEDIRSAQSRLAALGAARDLARQRLEDARLYAPTNGVIRNRVLEPGDMASPQRPVFTLALTDPIWVRAYVTEPDLGKIRPGMKAAVTTDSYPGKSWSGWVGFISPTAEFTPKYVQVPEVRTHLVYQVRIWVCDPDHKFRLGMPASVTIPLNQTVDTGQPARNPCRES